MYVPSDPSQVNVINGTYAQLQQFIQGDCSLAPFAGQIPPRNNCTSPWFNSLDFRYAVTVPTGGRTRVELTMNVFNLLNLLDKNWGWVNYPNFNSPTPSFIRRRRPPTASRRRTTCRSILSPTFAGRFTRDDLRSRWQAQWGLRVRF